MSHDPKAPLAFCTTCTSHIFGQATLLADSLLECGHTEPLHVLLLDTPKRTLAHPSIRLVSPREIPIPNFEQQAFRYGIYEFATSVKPRLIAWAQRNFQKTVFLDSDVRILGSLQPAIQLLDRSPISLTPHFLSLDCSPVSDTRVSGALQTGVFNTGWIGVSSAPEALRFTQWWSHYVDNHALSRVSMKQFTDQKAIDLVPALFEGVEVLRDPGMNVAVWNIFERDISRTTGEWTANGSPLRMFHYSGVKSGRKSMEPYMGALSGRATNPVLPGHQVEGLRRDALSVSPGFQSLIDDTLGRLAEHQAQWEAEASQEPPYTRLNSGDPIHPSTRLTYHLDPCLRRAAGDPFHNTSIQKLNATFHARDRWKTRIAIPGLMTLRDAIAGRILDRQALSIIENAVGSSTNPGQSAA